MAIPNFGSVDLVIVATPLNTHARLAELALRSGSDVYVEKPPVASMADFESLLAVQAETGRAVQVGFQTLGSAALVALASGDLGVGAIRAVSARGLWVRARSYWHRSPWAGKRWLAGDDVVDGVATNPLAHAVSAALAIADARRREDVASVETDLYRANQIEADDTSVVRVTTTAGILVTAALTLAAAENADPVIHVRGADGEADYFYTVDRVTTESRGDETFERANLFENLLDHRDHGVPLLSPLADSGAFMEVLEAIRVAEEPSVIAPGHVTWIGDGEAAHPVVDDIEWWIDRAADAQATFSELGVPWARARPDDVLDTVDLSGVAVMTVQGGSRVTATSSPRPYLHPLRTRGGVIVSDHHPRDHDWHLGLGFALQDVRCGDAEAGTNFWGGRTFVRDRGYLWLDDHGRIETRGIAVSGVGASARTLVHDLAWKAPDGALLIEERQTLEVFALDDSSWGFRVRFELTNPGTVPLSLGGPGSNGRDRAGYGGFTWRLAPNDDADIRTPDARGEDRVHGSMSAWLAWSAEFDGAPATIALAPADEVSGRDPWFVRCADYPGVGSALAWDRAVALAPGETLSRGFVGLIADGRLDDDRVAVALAELSNPARERARI